MMNSRQIVDRGRALADLQKTKFISLQDECDAVNEAWRDVYAQFVASDGDYWVKEIDIEVTSEMLDPLGTGSSYLINLPDDLYKLRAISAQSSGNWMALDPFSISQKDSYKLDVGYRLRGNQLWLSGTAVSKVKILYYPVLPEIEVAPHDFLIAEEFSAAERKLISDAVFSNGTVFFAKGNEIYSQLIDGGSPTLLFTIGFAAGVTVSKIKNLTLNNNFFYFVYSGFVYKVDLFASPSPNGSVTPIDVLADPLDPVHGFKIAGGMATVTFLQTGIFTFSVSQIDGGFSNKTFVTKDIAFSYQTIGEKTIYGFPPKIVYGDDFIGDFFIFTDTDNRLGDFLAVSNDGKIYFVNSKEELVEFIKLDEFRTIATDVQEINKNISNDSIVILNPTKKIVSTIKSTDLSYPQNQIPELIAYQVALIFCRRQMATDRIAVLNERYAQLWNNFLAVFRRDDYKAQQIDNAYPYYNRLI